MILETCISTARATTFLQSRWIVRIIKNGCIGTFRTKSVILPSEIIFVGFWQETIFPSSQLQWYLQSCKDDLKFCTSNNYLLVKRGNFNLTSNIYLKNVEAYLFYDSNEQIWISSRKITGEKRIGVRLRQHRQHATFTHNTGKKFYYLYLLRLLKCLH